MKKVLIVAMVIMLAGLAAYAVPREQMAKPPTIEIKADVTAIVPTFVLVIDQIQVEQMQTFEPTQFEKMEIQALGDVLWSKFRWRSQVYSINSGKIYKFNTSPVKYAVSNQNLSRMPGDGLRSKTSQEA